MSPTLRVHLTALGCRLNEAELEQWSRAFQRGGASIVEDLAGADVAVVNTCAVTGDAARKSRQLIRRLQRRNPNAKLIVSGCYASLEPTAVAAELGVDLVVDNRDKDRLIDIAVSTLALPIDNHADADAGGDGPFVRGRSRAFIKVQDGCRYRCSYCVVTLARGKERSRPPKAIIEEINRLHQQGTQEAVLSGVHLGGYGNDLALTLTELLERVLRETTIPRLRLGSLEPWALDGRFFQLFSDPRLMPHLHLPVQSGSNDVLRRMSRRGRAEDYRRLLSVAREAIAGFNVTTDVIVGFPGETQQDWQATLNFVEDAGFGHLHIFPFSPRAGTKAATLPDAPPRETVRERATELHELGERLKRDVLANAVGLEDAVLWECKSTPLGNNRKRCFGYTRNYLRAAVDVREDEQLADRIMNVGIDAVEHTAGVLLTTPGDR